ncbi:P-loop containing nucleoside triphosphate hydrolase protein [Punctularia strigosozonata HHB-11173 SS5]|uniref:P-loop containing nucleoside triphosphate hydrolase protein n=1 Tax=Punctularia strigosozonata (strain HHB-11173) TaxID=741275 RepID=UPI0004416BBA|nr:P-loop containing nucleoside triphosphate hydrolase protein [Punctularia strigosozonata HHB-11173 SS5]EIN12078.1 P-loop containing nucleoside triphosphate hydrolase protein [Punctularia strigosozonata HHB-11173 SS5]
MSSCSQDSSFGPGSTCRFLDFTLRFEQTIMSTLPDLVFLMLAGVRVFQLSRSGSAVRKLGFGLLPTKAFACLSCISLCVANTVLETRAHNRGTLSLWVASPIVQVISSVVMSVLVYYEHFNSVRPSALVTCYALLKSIFTAATVRTYVLIGLDHAEHGLFIACVLLVASYLAVMCVELIHKRALLQDQTLPKAITASWIYRSLYFWLFPLLWKGRKTTLTIDDCSDIPEFMHASASKTTLQKALQQTPRTSSYLSRASLTAFGGMFLTPILPRLIQLFATFAQPLLVNQMVGFISNPERPSDVGWALVGAFVCVYAVLAISVSLYLEEVYDVVITYRGALVGMIYEKSLRLNLETGRSVGSGAASTYMSVDVERICEGMQIFHEVWAALVSIVLSIIILYNQATWPAFLPLGVTFVVIALAGFVGAPIGKRQAAWLKSTDERVKFLSSVLQNFLPIKWARYEGILARKAAELRIAETKHARIYYDTLVVAVALSNTAYVFSLLSVIGPYAGLVASQGKAPLNPQRLFTIVATVSLLDSPLNLLGQTLPALAASYASLKRIHEFLLLPERVDKSPVEKDRETDYEDEKIKDELLRTQGTTISMQSASFSWSTKSDAFLQDIDLELSGPGVHMCVENMKGKSLLLASILGETVKKSGFYASLQSPIAYAQQDAFIIPGTIRENVVFGLEFDADRYFRVLDACALTEDIRRMPRGDGTLLGEKGRRLSGGQKQRIGLARAVYANADWTLLDDPLSALDAETELHVFRSLFGSGGLLAGKAILLVTHNLKHLHAANNVIVLEAGRILYQGTLDEIKKQGYVPHTEHSQSHPDIQEDSIYAAGTLTEHVAEQEDDEAPISPKSLGWTPYIFFAQMTTWPRTVLAALLIMSNGAIRVGLQVYTKEWSTHSTSAVAPWIGGYAGISVAFLVISLASLRQYCAVVTSYTGPRAHEAEISSVFNTVPAFFMKTPAGRILNRFSQDIFMLDFAFPISFLSVLTDSVTIVGTAVFIFIATPWLLVSVPALVIANWIVLQLYVRSSKQLQHLEAGSKSPLYTGFSSTLTGLETIRAFGVQGHFRSINDLHLDRSQGPYYYRLASLRFLRVFPLTVGLAGLSVGLRHSTDPAFLGLALSNLINLGDDLSRVLLSIGQLENGSVSISRIHEYSSLPPEESKYITELAKSKPPTQWPTSGSVTFDDVKLRYKADLAPALNSVSFRISGGKKVGVCGRTGSGKSTLIMALFRALDDSLLDGRILIDDLDTQSISVTTLRGSLSLVSQEPFIWRATLRENLDPEGLRDEEEMWAALKDVGMAEAVGALPEKLDAMLEESGSFSKGQCQLLCLARVLLRRKRIVVLDEASIWI